MANFPGAFAYPLCDGLYGMMDAGPKAPPPPVNYPGAYAYPYHSQQLFGMTDSGPRFPHGPIGKARGGTTFPFNPNVRGIFKRYDRKQKPI